MANRNASHGRHGGNHNQADEVRNQDPTKAATRNTDVESMSKDRNVSRGGDRHSGG